MKNSQVVLDHYIAGEPKPENFRLEEFEDKSCDTLNLEQGHVLVQVLYLSVDPYMRSFMYGKNPFFVGGQVFDLKKPLYGDGVGKIIHSKSDKFKEGDYVAGIIPWKKFAALPGDKLKKILVDKDTKPSWYLGVFGINGLAAYFGLMEVGHPKKGETVLVSAASGGVGSIVGQLAKIKGCNVVGIAGSDEKIKHITKDFGFDRGINYKKVGNMADAIKQACPQGVDVYFDNVGGETLEATIDNAKKGIRIIICGAISTYNLMDDKSKMYGIRNLPNLVYTSGKIQGFMYLDYEDRFPGAIEELRQYVKEGKLKHEETVVDGIENMGRAFVDLLSGQHTGKVVVKISDEKCVK